MHFKKHNFLLAFSRSGINTRKIMKKNETYFDFFIAGAVCAPRKLFPIASRDTVAKSSGFNSERSIFEVGCFELDFPLRFDTQKAKHTLIRKSMKKLQRMVGNSQIMACQYRHTPLSKLTGHQKDAASPHMDFSPIVAKVAPSIAKVYCLDAAGKVAGTGSGFLYSKKGIMVTCDHMVEGSHSLLYRFSDEPAATFHTAKAALRDAEHDLALLKIETDRPPLASLSDESEKIFAQECLCCFLAIL
jgi:hypothetical protein